MSNDSKPADLEYHHEVQEHFNIQDLHAPIMREKAEPRDGHEPIPPGFAPLFGGLIFWAGFFFAGHFADFNPGVLSEDPQQGAGAGPPKQLTLAEKGEGIFQSICAACHGPAGAGTPGTVPPLAKSEWLQDRSPAVVVRILMHGATGPIEVLGQSYNANMKVDLSDAQIAAAATYVRTNLGNTPKVAGDVSEEYVKAARKNAGARTAAWTATELKAIADDFLDAPLGTGKPEAKDKPAEKDKK
jgi:mono/diheme cytochrome c family protein